MRSCSGCGARLEATSCTYCGLTASEAPDLVGATGDGRIPCPSCGSEQTLASRQLGGAAVEACPSCGGLWVPVAAFDGLVQRTGPSGPARSGAPRPSITDVRYRRCPACGQHMARENYGRVSGVIIDRCPVDGVWLDSGELAALRSFVAGGGLDRARAAQAEKDRTAEKLSRLRESNAVDDLRMGLRLGGWY